MANCLPPPDKQKVVAAATTFMQCLFILCFPQGFKASGLGHNFWLFQLIIGLDHHSAFHPFFLDFTGNVIGLMDITGKGFVIRMAAAGAEELRPAVHAFRFREHMVCPEIMHHLHVL